MSVATSDIDIKYSAARTDCVLVLSALCRVVELRRPNLDAILARQPSNLASQINSQPPTSRLRKKEVCHEYKV
jgi:hypothetical protein